jgi:hypothetical protein
MGGVGFPRPQCLRPLGWAAATAVLLAAAPAQGAVAGVSGRVLQAEDPVAEAVVYAYRVVEHTFSAVKTNGAGEFLFASLPAGLYKIVALKSGMMPAVLVLARQAAEDSQYVQVELTANTPGETDFWTLRGEVTSDVLRQLTPSALLLSPVRLAPSTALRGQVTADASVEQIGDGLVAQSAGAQVDVRSVAGRVRFGLQGSFRNLAVAGDAQEGYPGFDAATGTEASFRLNLTGSGPGLLAVSGQTRRIDGRPMDPLSNLNFARYQVRYERAVGEEASADFNAFYVDESGVTGTDRVVPFGIPEASRVWAVQGGYGWSLGDDGKLGTGMRYRETLRDTRLPGPDLVSDRYLDLWSKGSSDVGSTMVFHYGLFSTLHDGSVSLVPQGEVVVHLSPLWQASVSASQEIRKGDVDPLRSDFAAYVFNGSHSCDDAEMTCYQARLARGEGSDDQFRVQGSLREFDRTVRMLLQEETLAGSEGIFFVPGDQLPELHASLRQKIGGSLVADWSSSYGSGGGGQYRAANRRMYSNEVAYLSTSISTRILPSSTGVYVAFHRAEQRLEPVRRAVGRRSPGAPVSAEMERLELALSQDLSALFELASDWAIRVGMEFVRGGTLLSPLPPTDGVRRNVTTSVAVRF